MTEIQLTFDFEKKKRENIEYPWSFIFPEWVPEIGGLAQIGKTFIDGYGFSYMDTMRIIKIENQKVVCVYEHWKDPNFWKNRKKCICSIYDLWPICGVHF
ncbi:hypothetical protein [Sunxiuqinia indica]|uniref:hypothetical protein n=1 Tax=Sunxiuqinia indica TaxID=2692584 RepID=UPI00135CDF16|nr:hypothetical protein [Sunxiuqinia indica]